MYLSDLKSAYIVAPQIQYKTDTHTIDLGISNKQAPYLIDTKPKYITDIQPKYITDTQPEYNTEILKQYTTTNKPDYNIFDLAERYLKTLKHTPKEHKYDVTELDYTIARLPSNTVGLTEIKYKLNGTEIKPDHISIYLDPSITDTKYKDSVKTHELVHAQQADILPYIDKKFNKLIAEGDATIVQKANNKHNITNTLYEKYETVVKSLYDIIGEGNINLGRKRFNDTIRSVKDFKTTITKYKNKFTNTYAEDLYNAIKNPETNINTEYITDINTTTTDTHPKIHYKDPKTSNTQNAHRIGTNRIDDEELYTIKNTNEDEEEQETQKPTYLEPKTTKTETYAEHPITQIIKEFNKKITEIIKYSQDITDTVLNQKIKDLKTEFNCLNF
ncbi:MAG: hypothetical protein K0B02_00975 [DPANN group archaeon]|nr:hypothetical protein [DPANN group archaeon]